MPTQHRAHRSRSSVPGQPHALLRGCTTHQRHPPIERCHQPSRIDASSTTAPEPSPEPHRQPPLEPRRWSKLQPRRPHAATPTFLSVGEPPYLPHGAEPATPHPSKKLRTATRPAARMVIIVGHLLVRTVASDPRSGFSHPLLIPWVARLCPSSPTRQDQAGCRRSGKPAAMACAPPPCAMGHKAEMDQAKTNMDR
jgi:hypothetical protein